MNTLSLDHHPTPSSDPTHTPSRSSLLSTRSKSNKATVGAKSSSILSKQPDLSTSSKRPLANRFELENNETVVSPASISVYQELRRIYDLSVQGVPPEFRKISDLVRHVNSFSRTVDRTGLASCRVVLVNTGSESKQGAGREGVNDTSHELINLMSSIVRYGGILVAPEDFTPSPSNTLNTDDDRTRRRAEEENWTTHVVASSPSARKTPTFAEVLNCLGRKGIAVEELGCYVRVVRKQWVTFAKIMGSKGMETFLSCEGAHLIRPDLRDQIKQRSTPQAAPSPQPLPSPKVEKVARESGRSRRGHISSGQETSEGVSDDSDDWWQTRKVVRHAFDGSSQPPPGSFVTQVDKKNLRTPKKLFNEIVAKRCCRRKGEVYCLCFSEGSLHRSLAFLRPSHKAGISQAALYYRCQKVSEKRCDFRLWANEVQAAGGKPLPIGWDPDEGWNGATDDDYDELVEDVSLELAASALLGNGWDKMMRRLESARGD